MKSEEAGRCLAGPLDAALKCLFNVRSCDPYFLAYKSGLVPFQKPSEKLARSGNCPKGRGSEGS